MATTRFFSKDGQRIIDEHDDGRNFFYFADRRLDGFCIRPAGGGPAVLATPSANAADYNTGLAEADTGLTSEGGTVIDGGVMTATRRQRWNRIMLLEWFIWPSFLDIEAGWTTENNNIKKAEMRGCFMADGVSRAEAVSIANAYIPGGTKPRQTDIRSVDNFKPVFRDAMSLTEQNSADSLGTHIEAERTGPRKRDIVMAFRELLNLRNFGWTRLKIEIFHYGNMSISIGRNGLVGGPGTTWEWKYYTGEPELVNRSINNVADKMYKAARDAANAP